MKRFLSRLFSSHPLSLIAAACLIALAIPAYRWLDAERANVGAVPRAIAVEGDKTRAFLGAQIAGTRAAVLDAAGNQVQELRIDLFAEIGSTRRDLFGLAKTQLDAFRSAADARIGGALAEVHGAVGEVHTLNANLGPLLTASSAAASSVAGLADAYRVLPDRAAAEVRPAWLSLEPEITCREADGAGYGGCWHSRITALMGEASRVGGVFTQHFPALASAFDKLVNDFQGIAADVHDATTNLDHKYFHPAPVTFWGRVKQILSDLELIFIAALRGGVL